MLVWSSVAVRSYTVLGIRLTVLQIKRHYVDMKCTESNFDDFDIQRMIAFLFLLVVGRILLLLSSSVIVLFVIVSVLSRRPALLLGVILFSKPQINEQT